MTEIDKTSFSELIITADVHEQANCKVKTRILGLQKFVEELGGCFQEEHLGDGYGLDYKAEGYYKGKEISLGVEYKVFLNDFVPNHGILEKRFGAAREHYDNIALVIEGESLAKTSQIVGDKNIWYVNPAVIDGSADQMMNRQMFEDRVQVWTESGVLVRNIKVEDEFPITFLYLLEYITKDEDWFAKHMISLPNSSFENQYINTILSFGIEKVGQKTAKKVTKSFPNLFWLCEAHEDHLKDALGKVTGKNISDFIHNNSLITVEWQNGGSKAQLSKETEKALKSNPEQSIAKPDISDDYLKVLEKEDLIVKQIKPFILGFLRQNPSGLSYKDIEKTVNAKFNVCGLSDEAIKELMNDGDCYEPRVGFIIATEEPSKCIEVPKGSYVNGGKIYDINPQRDQEPETLQSSSVESGEKSSAIKMRKFDSSIDTLDTSTAQKATESGKVANLSDSDLGTESKSSSVDKSENSDGNGLHSTTKLRNEGLINTPDTSQSQGGTNSKSNLVILGNSALDTSQSSITDDQPKAILNSTYPNPPPSAASSKGGDIDLASVDGKDVDTGYRQERTKEKSEAHVGSSPTHPINIPEPPDNSEFQSNPYLRDIENFIRNGGKSLDEIGKEFGLSEMMALKGVNELMKKHRVWFCKADKKIYFGIDKNPAPVVADKPLDIGI